MPKFYSSSPAAASLVLRDTDKRSIQPRPSTASEAAEKRY